MNFFEEDKKVHTPI